MQDGARQVHRFPGIHLTAKEKPTKGKGMEGGSQGSRLTEEQRRVHIQELCGRNAVSPPNLNVKALPPSVTAFGGRVFGSDEVTSMGPPGQTGTLIARGREPGALSTR